MSDTSLRDSAEAELRQTTIGWNRAKTYAPEVLAPTHWGKGLAYLAAISDANRSHVDAALVYLKKTTKGYSPTATNWKKAFAELAKVTDAPPPPPPTFTLTTNIAPSSVISSPVVWTATADTALGEVRFSVDGVEKSVEKSAPYQFNGDPDGRLSLTAGSHVLGVSATATDGRIETISVPVTGGAPPLPPPGSIYPASSLYPSEVSP